jgi:hypothetical protein
VVEVSMGDADPEGKADGIRLDMAAMGICCCWGRRPQWWRWNPCMPSWEAGLGFG